MRSFLYLARLPRRAIAVAQQAIEEDSEFRARVAARASEADVGRAGYLWLHRPIGWAPEFEDLAHRAGSVDDPAASIGDFVDVTSGHVSPDRGHLLMGGSDEPHESSSAVGTALSNGGGNEPTDGLPVRDVVDVSAGSEVDPEADAIESELTSLRGLVDRLAGERELVMSGSSKDIGEGPDIALLEDELATVNTELEFSREELDRVNHELATVRQEREESQRQMSEALRRQVEVERELAQVREARVDIENRASDLQVNLISAEDRLKRLQADLEETERERNVVQSQLETMTTERNQVREDRMAIKAERDNLQARLADVDEKTGGVDVGELTAANRSLTQELEATSRELARMIAQVESYEDQLRTTTATADTLKSEKVELSSRLADAELSLETTKTQYSALKGDADRLAAEVGTLRAERDGLQSQLTELQASLSDVLDEHAEIRHRNDADRKALNELRVERDVLLARMSDIEQADRSYENRINALIKERDDLGVARDDLMAERGELRGEVAAAASARDQLLEKIDALETKLGPLEIELQAERRQREELANRLLELDDIAAQNQAAIGEVTSERDQLAEDRHDLAEKLKVLEAERIDSKKLTAERDDLQVRLERTEAQRDDEASRRMSAVSELSEQVSELEAARNSLDQQMVEAQSELNRVRSDIDELNRENAKLRFNLQVAESSVTEVTEAADEARKNAAEANARAVAAEARADRAEADAEESRASLAATEELAAARHEPQGVAAGWEAATLDATPTTIDGAVAGDEPRIEAESVVAVEQPVDEVAAKTPEAVETAVGGADGSADETETPGEAAAEVFEGAEDQFESVEAQITYADSGDAAGQEDSLVEEIGLGADGVEAVDDVEADVADDDQIFEAVPSLLEPVDVDAGGGDALADQLPSLDADEVLAADDPTTTIPGFTPISEVVGIDHDRRGDPTVPFNNDWKPIDDSASEPDELDEISKLISATVSSFENPIDDLAPEPPAFNDQAAYVDDVSAPPSVFGGNDDLDGSLAAFDSFGGPVDSGGGRRQIEIPDEISDDEIAVALHVVSSPDVVLLVDGDSVAKLGWPSLPVAQQRDALVTYLADLSASSGAAPDVVFDGRIGDDDSLPVSRAVRIRLSTPPTEPVAALDELVSAYPDQWPIALVTDDAELAASARARGAAVLNNGQLLDLFIAQ
ncbi:MAG: hypothetical protein OER95_11170 [Acidimicrobiia bacterium]|nr:hypothetical protein [Acidimicrobiia bacterium]